LKAWILSIGTELLIGRVVNTNAAWLSKRLTLMGFNVERIIVVPDVIDDVVEEVRRGLGRAKLIVTTGGLGPTHDDITMEALALALGRSLVLNPEAELEVKSFYSKRGLPLTRERLKMAYMPEGCKVLRNPIGSAPGCYTLHGDTLIIALPGVPEEMEAMFETEALKPVSQLAPVVEVVECYVTVKGVPESSLAPLLRDLARRYEEVYIKSHPKGYEMGRPVVEVRALASSRAGSGALEKARAPLEVLISKASDLGGVVEGVYCTK